MNTKEELVFSLSLGVVKVMSVVNQWQTQTGILIGNLQLFFKDMVPRELNVLSFEFCWYKMTSSVFQNMFLLRKVTRYPNNTYSNVSGPVPQECSTILKCVMV